MVSQQVGELACGEYSSDFLEAVEVELLEFFVAFFDLLCGFGLEFLEDFKKLAGIEGVEDVVGEFARGATRGLDNDEGNFGMDFSEGGEEIVADHVGHAGVGDDAVDSGEFAQCFDRFFTGIGRDDVEFGGLDDELAGRDSGGGFAIDDEEAGAKHGSL